MALLYPGRVVPSRRVSLLVLWALFLLTIPVPYYLGAVEVAPALRLSFLSALVLAVVATEGVGGYQGLLALLAALQSLLWPLALLGAAWLGAAALQRWVPERARAGVLAGAAAALLALTLLPVYATELSSRGPTASLAGLLD